MAPQLSRSESHPNIQGQMPPALPLGPPCLWWHRGNLHNYRLVLNVWADWCMHRSLFCNHEHLFIQARDHSFRGFAVSRPRGRGRAHMLGWTQPAVASSVAAEPHWPPACLETRQQSKSCVPQRIDESSRLFIFKPDVFTGYSLDSPGNTNMLCAAQNRGRQLSGGGSVSRRLPV